MDKKSVTRNTLIFSGAVTLIICCVMNLYLLPLIESTTQGIRAFDMNSLGYSFEQAKTFVSLLSEEGMKTYLFRQLPLDFIYPIAYTVFFSLSILKLRGDKKWLVVFPLLLMISDYIENIITIVMLRTDFSSSVAAAGSCVTTIKSVLMYITIILVLVLFVLWLIKRRKEKE